VQISVRDSGPGIPPERLQEIFKPFFTSKTYSSGLGLAVSQKIVADHGGTIDAASESGGGATFTVNLPREPAERSAPMAS
jgi:signal transduction histidine kinase